MFGSGNGRGRPRADGVAHATRRIAIGFAAFVVVCTVGVAGYVVAGWGLADAAYMVIITIFGVGYGEVRPIEGPWLRAFTGVVIVAGYGAVIYTVGGFIQALIDGELSDVLGERRMQREIDALDGHTVLCGFGRMGQVLADQLEGLGIAVVAVEGDEARAASAIDHGHLVVTGDATDEEVLERAGIARAATLATVLSDDAANVFVTLTARSMNPELVIVSRGEGPHIERKLLGCGADKVVMPTAIGAAKVSDWITRPSAEELLDRLRADSRAGSELVELGLTFAEIDVDDHPGLAGRPIGDVEIRGQRDYLIVASRGRAGTTFDPPPHTALADGDTLIVLGHADDRPQVIVRTPEPAG